MFREDDGVSEAKRQSCVWKLKPGLRGVLAAKRDCGTEFSISMAITHEVMIFNSQSGELNNAAFRVLLFVAFQRRQSDLRFAGVGTVNGLAVVSEGFLGKPLRVAACLCTLRPSVAVIKNPIFNVQNPKWRSNANFFNAMLSALCALRF